MIHEAGEGSNDEDTDYEHVTIAPNCPCVMVAVQHDGLLKLFEVDVDDGYVFEEPVWIKLSRMP